MHRNKNVRVQLADLADHLREVIRGCRSEMKATHDGVYLLYTGDLHCLAHGVDDADVPTRTDDDQTPVFQVETGRVFMDMLIRDNLALHFGRQIVAGIAPGAILELELHHRVRKHFLDAASLDLSSGESLAANHHRRFAQYHFDVMLADIPTVQH